MSGRIVGIDLGTTNSEVAARVGDRVEVLAEDGNPILPSVVGVAPDGRLLVGEEAVNQLVLFPERTVRAIKRLMGTDERVRLGDREGRPQEVSALILGALRARAEKALGESVTGAVITVPAWFTDAQRQATREAGDISGLEVHRILNEPTAASLAYAGDHGGVGTYMVYDLGGGTFDVSIVRMEDGVNEVLASHGDTRLGGEDLDRVLLDLVMDRAGKKVREAAGGDARIAARIRRAVEAARCRLSFEPYAKIREEALLTDRAGPVNLEVEVSREEFEERAHPLLARTIESVHHALEAARLKPKELTGVLLAGGTTRTPLVRSLLADTLGHVPRTDLHPDLCVALGAGWMAARVSGEENTSVLVDITPYSFGPSHCEETEFGDLLPDRYSPVLVRGTPLPASATDSYYTVVDDQDIAEVIVYQGESPNALENIEIGRFFVEGLSDVPAGNEILCRLSLDLDGILEVTATERATGLSRSVRIEGAVGRLGTREKAAAKKRVASLLGRSGEEGEGAPDVPDEQLPAAAREVVERYLRVRDRLHEEDRSEGDALLESLRGRKRGKKVDEAVAELTDLLFYAEGNQD